MSEDDSLVFAHATHVRSHAGVCASIHGVSLMGLLVIHVFYLNNLAPPFNWVAWFFGPVLLIIFAWAAVIWWKGGSYRVTIQGGLLTIESPDSSMFGSSAKIPIAEIAELEISPAGAGSEGIPDRHWIILGDGSRICLDETWCGQLFLDADKLFRAISSLDDRIKIETKE